MPGKYGSGSVTVSLDATPGGSLQAITGHVLEMGGAKIESATELSHTFGDTSEEHTPAGMRKVPDISLSGFWDTTLVTGPHAVLADVDDDPNDSTRTLVLVFGDGKTFTVECRLVSYEVVASRGALTKFNAVLRPTGNAVWS